MSVRVWAIAYGFISILLLLLRSFARVFFHIWIVYTKRVRACHWVFFVCCCLSVCHSFEKMIHKIVVKSSCAIKIDIAQNYNDFQRKMKWNFAVYIIWVREKESERERVRDNSENRTNEWTNESARVKTFDHIFGNLHGFRSKERWQPGQISTRWKVPLF